MVYIEEVDGEVEALGSVGWGCSFFENGGYVDVGEPCNYGLPFFAGSEIGVEFYLAVVEWFEFLLFEVPLQLLCPCQIGMLTLRREIDRQLILVVLKRDDVLVAVEGKLGAPVRSRIGG